MPQLGAEPWEHPVVAAQSWFLWSQLAPMVGYYLGMTERPTKFPATISHTIRRGPTKLIHHALWLRGWQLMLRHVRPGPYKWFCRHMLATGLVAVVLCPIGRNRDTDRVHFVSAGLYMLDHIVLFRMLRIRNRYLVAFALSFALLALALFRRKRIERRAGLPSEADVDNQVLEDLRKLRLDRSEQQLVWWLDLAVMVFENGLFAAFTLGMQSGIVDETGSRLQ